MQKLNNFCATDNKIVVNYKKYVSNHERQADYNNKKIK